MGKRALFSVNDLTNIREYATSLVDLGWHIIATHETKEVLSKEGISVEDVADFVGVTEYYGFPPTLHPKMEAALTLKSDICIDLVYDIPYPLTIGNDVGGRTLLALGAKGNRIVVFSHEDMERVISELKKHGCISDAYRKQLIDKVNVYIATHYLNLTNNTEYRGIIGHLSWNLLHGENPYQSPAELFSSEDTDPLSINKFQQLSGDTPCFTNIADLDCILQTLCLATEAFRLRYGKIPYIAIGAKHGNPCGMAIDWNDPMIVIEKTLWGNPLAIWGGEFITNFAINEDIANLLLKSKLREEMIGNANWMLDLICAPNFTQEAIEALSKRKLRKLFKNSTLEDAKLPSFKWTYRFVRGGFLSQPPPNYILDITKTQLIGSHLQTTVLDSLIIVWAVAWSSNHGGNEIAIANDGQLIGVGGGPSTVDSATTAVLRAKNNNHNMKESVFGANAFFPFTDAPKVLVEAGCKYGLVPAGGKNESVVQRYFQDAKVSMIYLPQQYRGFCRH